MKSESLAFVAALATTAIAIFENRPPPRPAGPAQMLDLDAFPWTDPFNDNNIEKFTSACRAQRTFPALEFLLDDLKEAPPKGVAPYFDVLKKLFSERQYPGSWAGVDPHGYDRKILQMEYADVPLKVREWIEEQQRSAGDGKGLFAVFEKPAEGKKAAATAEVPVNKIAEELTVKDKVVLFAPGAAYSILPLWVAEGSDCPDTLLNTSIYSPTIADGGVVAWITKHTKAKRTLDRRDMEFTIEAQVLKAAEEALKDEL